MEGHPEDHASEASRIVERLLDDAFGSLDIDEHLVIADLEADAREFTSELEFLSEVDADVPAAQVEDRLVPVALSIALGSTWPPLMEGWSLRYRPLRHNPMFYEWARELRYRLEGVGIPYRIPRGEARSIFHKGATEFLTTRMAATRGHRDGNWSTDYTLSLPQRIGGQHISTPGCNFTVSTNSIGLRVFWSGAYRISSRYFSHPTTPTTSVLQSGRYVFGVDGGAYGNVIQWDQNAVVTLPGQSQVHLNF